MSSSTNKSNSGSSVKPDRISEAFKERLDEVRKLIDEDRYRRRVLVLCQQAEPRSFEDYSSSGSFRKLEKFESSTYSEVLKAIDQSDNNKPVVMKIMRALSRGVMRKLPTALIKGSQSYNDILNELVVVQALSQLHDGVLMNGKSLYKTHFFCTVHEIKVVTGNLDKILGKPGNEATSSAVVQQDQHHQQQQQTSTSNVVNKENVKPTGVKAKESSNQGIDDKAKALDQANKQQQAAENNNKPEQPKVENVEELSEEDRMLMEALPREYVISVMKHDGHPLWWMMTHRRLSAEQLASVLVQVIVGIAIAEKVYSYEHRDLHVSNILIKKTSKSTVPFVLDGNRYKIITQGIKATIIDATFSRLSHNGKVYYRDLTTTLRNYGSKKTPVKMSLQNRSYREMVHLTNNNWEEFTPKTNLIWLTYLCETMMKNDTLKSSSKLHDEVRKIRDYTVKVNTTIDLLSYFPFEKESGVSSVKSTVLSNATNSSLNHKSIGSKISKP